MYTESMVRPQITLSLLILPMLLASRLSAQPFTLEAFTVDGGGGTSTGGNYTLTGTIGQPDPGRLAGGNYTLEGGFWAVVAEVIVPGSPELTIRSLSNGAVQICWPSTALGFQLEDTSSLTAPAWSPSTLVPTNDGAMNCVTVPPPNDSRFYRLVK